MVSQAAATTTATAATTASISKRVCYTVHETVAPAAGGGGGEASVSWGMRKMAKQREVLYRIILKDGGNSFKKKLY